MANQLYQGANPLATTCPNVVDNLTSTSSTDALSAKQGKVLNEKIEDDEKVEVIPFTPSASATVSPVVYKVGTNLLVISFDVKFSSVGGGWTEAFTISMPGKKCDGVFGVSYNGILAQAFGNNGIVVRLFAPSVNVSYRGFVVVPLQDM